MSEITENCEQCGYMGVEQLASRYFGWDDTPLCEMHFDEADANYEAAVRDGTWEGWE